MSILNTTKAIAEEARGFPVEKPDQWEPTRLSDTVQGWADRLRELD